jgi:hypothetical protein
LIFKKGKLIKKKKQDKNQFMRFDIVHDESTARTRVEKRLPMTEHNRIPANVDHAEEHWVR